MGILKQEFDQETGTSNDFGFAPMIRSHSMNRISPTGREGDVRDLILVSTNVVVLEPEATQSER